MSSGIVTPSVYDYKDPNPVFVYGEPLVTFGFENMGVINGLGLVSRGLLWNLYDIWFDNDYYSQITTSWSNADSVITTTWTNLQFGMSGEYTP